jgi:hypothetical protein
MFLQIMEADFCEMGRNSVTWALNCEADKVLALLGGNFNRQHGKSNV